VTQAIDLTDSSALDIQETIILTIDQRYVEIDLFSKNPGDPEMSPGFFLLGIDISYNSQFNFPSSVMFNYHNTKGVTGNFSWTIDTFTQD